MAYTTLTLGLTLTLPTNGTRNWGTTLKNTTWTKISQHRHEGSGDGNQIRAAGLASDAVTTVKILDLNVTAAKLAADSVTTAKILDLNVTTAKINDLAVTTGKINDLAVTTGKLAANAVTTAKLAKNYGYTHASTLSPSGTSQEIDFDNGNVQVLNLASASGNVTATFANPATGSTYHIFTIQAATPRTITWPTVLWVNGQAPILSTANNSVDHVWLYYNGAAYYGDWNVNYV